MQVAPNLGFYLNVLIAYRDVDKMRDQDAEALRKNAALVG